jgi:hypothetical protein
MVLGPFFDLCLRGANLVECFRFHYTISEWRFQEKSVKSAENDDAAGTVPRKKETPPGTPLQGKDSASDCDAIRRNFPLCSQGR